MPEPTTADAKDLLKAWEFDCVGDDVTFFVKPVTIWEHAALPEAEWTITLEDRVVLHSWVVQRIIQAVVKVAERTSEEFHAEGAE